jgi:hypothetical protein
MLAFDYILHHFSKFHRFKTHLTETIPEQTGAFYYLKSKATRGVEMTIHLHRVPRLWMCAAMRPPPRRLRAVTNYAQGQRYLYRRCDDDSASVKQSTISQVPTEDKTTRGQQKTPIFTCINHCT